MQNEPYVCLEVGHQQIRSAMSSAMEDRDRVQGDLATSKAKFGAEKRVLSPTFDHIKRHFSNVQAL